MEGLKDVQDNVHVCNFFVSEKKELALLDSQFSPECFDIIMLMSFRWTLNAFLEH